MPSQVQLVLVTVSGAEEAERIASSVVERRLAACTNIIGPMRSVYRWQGKIENDAEFLLILKTTQPRFAALAATIEELHSYDTPEVLAIDVADGTERYVQWVVDSVGADADE